MSQNARPVVLIADKLAQSTVDALGDGVEIRWVDGPNRSELLAALLKRTQYSYVLPPLLTPKH